MRTPAVFLAAVAVLGGALSPVSRAEGAPAAPEGGGESGLPAGGVFTVTPVWGAAFSIAGPFEQFFRLGAYTPAWKFAGATGGARIDGDPDDARAFAIEPSGNNGENVAEGALRFDGRAWFRGLDDGGVEASWTVVPDRDGELPEVMIEARFALGDVAGGVRVDDAVVSLPSAVPKNPHLFRGVVRRLETLRADGTPRLCVSFPEGAAVLVQDNRGWGNPVVTLRFFFVQGAVEKGRAYPLHAVFRVPGFSGRVENGAQVVAEAGPDWIPFVPAGDGEDWIEPGSALDLLPTLPHHEPAGAFGRVVAVGDHFELEGRPGEEIRFCGVNVVHGGNVPSVECADRFAANLARMGVNSVRIHHHERPLLAKGDRAALAVDPGALGRFDALCAAFIRHGIYLTTDLYVSRAPISWRSIGIDRDGTMEKDQFKMLVAFHEGAYSNLLAWSRAFLLHVNPHTGRCLAEEPALATLALVNEGNIGNWGRDALLAIPGVAESWRDWCAANGRKPRDLSDLPADLYEAKGRGKELSNDFAVFLADAEIRLARRLESFLRDELGCRAPLSSLSSWYNPASYSLVRATFDYDDDHGYVDHPLFLGARWRLPSTHVGSCPLLGGDGVPGFAWRRLFGKPFCVSEWNWAAPGEYRQVSGLVMGALAARQGWAGLWRFAWSHDRGGVERPGSVRMRYFDLHADPSLCASERAVVTLFRRGDMPPLPETAASPVVADEKSLRGGRGAAARLGPPANAPSGWKTRIGVALSGAVPGDAGADPASAPDDPVVLDPSRGAFAVDTPRTAGGFAFDGSLAAGPVSFSLEGAPAAVWASSVDGEPLASSSRILLSHVTDSRNTAARFDDAACRVWIDYGTTPALVRRGSASVSLSVAPGDWRVWRLSSSGRRLGEIPARRDADGGRLEFLVRTDYDPSAATLSYELAREP